MNGETITSNHKKHILQVFYNQYTYLKNKKSFNDRRDLSVWKDELVTQSAHMQNSNLLIPKHLYSVEMENADLVVISDSNTDELLLDSLQFFVFNGHKKRYSIFKLLNNEDHLELYLHYDLFTIGEPRRHNFKLCNIEYNVPIEVKINGKLDYSYSRGKERTYKEQSFIFHLLEKTDTFIMFDSQTEGIVKQVPKPEKVVNLMKRLY